MVSCSDRTSREGREMMRILIDLAAGVAFPLGIICMCFALLGH
jgi:hypothetical protein